jgi:branched-chain amino acid transport system substrate-binding protein
VPRAVLVTPLSGSLGGYGQAGADALALWAGWHNDRFSPPIELAVFDAHPDPVAALKRSRQGAADLLFGPYGSGPTAAVAAATSRLVWNHGGAWAPEADNLLTVLAPADTYFHGAIRAVRDSDAGVRTLCVLSSGTGFSDAVAQGAAAEATSLGLRAISGRLPGDAQPADMLLVAGGFADETAAAHRLLPGNWRAAGFVGAGVDEVLAALGPVREGLLGPAQWLAQAAPRPDDGPSAAEFVAAYRRRTGDEPPYPAAQAFAAGVIATRCLREAGSTGDDALLAAACRLDVTTMFGRFRLDSHTRRQVGHQVLTVQWQDGVRRVIWPPERAQAGLRFPLALGSRWRPAQLSTWRWATP